MSYFKSLKQLFMRSFTRIRQWRRRKKSRQALIRERRDRSLMNSLYWPKDSISLCSGPLPSVKSLLDSKRRGGSRTKKTSS